MDVKKLATLTKLTVDKKEESFFKEQFEETLKIIDEFDKAVTLKTKRTYIVTGTQNVLREDKVNAGKVLSQEDALTNAKKTHNGYFVVDAILNEY